VIVQRRLDEFRQGDVLLVSHFASLALDTTSQVVVEESRPESLVIVTQTCDVVRARSDPQAPRLLQAAVVVSVTDPNRRALYLRGDSPRYVPVPLAGDNAFADLDSIISVQISLLEGCDHYHGLPDDAKAASQFGKAVARKFGRYPFPDDLAVAVEALRTRILDRRNRPDSPEGRVLLQMIQIRAEALPDWGADHIDVFLVFIMRRGFMPPFEPEARVTEDLAVQLPQHLDSPAEVASRLTDNLSPADRSFVLRSLVNSWSRLYRPSGVVTSLEGEMLGEDEYTVERYWSSESLDLDYLSGPLTRD
jgi:hypothetical protein